MVMLGRSMSLAVNMRLSFERSILCTSINSSASLCPGDSSFCRMTSLCQNEDHNDPSSLFTHAVYPHLSARHTQPCIDTDLDHASCAHLSLSPASFLMCMHTCPA